MNKKEAKKILYEAIGNYSDKGNELLFACPSCNHHKRKFSVNLDKNAFKCWVCDYRGRNLRRVVRRFGTYIQLQKWDSITNRSDLERFADLFMEPESGESAQKLELPKEFISLCHDKIPATGMYALRYLSSRGISKEDIVRWKIGYCFSGEYRNRIIFPSFDNDGDVNYFVGRSYNGDSYKYKNPKASKNIVFNHLYVDWNKDLTIVEGIFMHWSREMLFPFWAQRYAQTPTSLERSSEMTRQSILHLTPTQQIKNVGLLRRCLNMISSFIK